MSAYTYSKPLSLHHSYPGCCGSSHCQPTPQHRGLPASSTAWLCRQHPGSQDSRITSASQSVSQCSLY